MTPAAAALAALVLSTAAPHSHVPHVPHVAAGGTGAAGAAVHDLHETYADLAIEGTTVAGRLQFFKRDLERALGPILDADAITLTPGPEADVLVLRYLRDRLTLVARGDTLRPTLLRSAEIELGHHPGWELTISWRANAPIDTLRVRSTLLFELHDDQRNVMRFARFPDETRETVTTEPGKGEVVVGPARAGRGLDFSGVDRFWEVVDLLALGEEPSDSVWDALFATPGYAALTRSEFSPAFFREKFSLAFRPDRERERDEVRADDRYLRHYERVARERGRLATIRKELESGSATDRAMALVRPLLPSGAGPVRDAPPVAFVIFANDARGYEPVVVDLMATRSFDLVPFLAHEFHHWFRNRQARHDGARLPEADRDAWWVLRQLEAEGIADQVGNRGFFRGDLPLTSDDRAFHDAVASTPAVLATLDSLLARTVTDPRDAAAVGARMRELLPRSGHPTGYYMASLVRARLGDDALVATVGDPIAFVRAYQRAASGEPGRVRFSETALEALDRLELRLEE